jgi:glutaredoxin
VGVKSRDVCGSGGVGNRFGVERVASSSGSTGLLRGEINQLGEGQIMAKKIEVFSAGCSTCKETIETVKRLAGSNHEVVVHDMNKSDVAAKAKGYGVRSVPAVVIDGKLASCCAGRGPEEHVLKSALA